MALVKSGTRRLESQSGPKPGIRGGPGILQPTSSFSIRPSAFLKAAQNYLNIFSFSPCANAQKRFNTGRVERLEVKPNSTQHTNTVMAKALSKSQIATAVAEKHGLTKKQAVEILEGIAQLAYKQAKNTFTLPGLGKLVLVNRAARIGRNPATGEQINIPAKRVVKFRVAKAAKKVAIFAAKKATFMSALPAPAFPTKSAPRRWWSLG